MYQKPKCTNQIKYCIFVSTSGGKCRNTTNDRYCWYHAKHVSPNLIKKMEVSVQCKGMNLNGEKCRNMTYSHYCGKHTITSDFIDKRKTEKILNEDYNNKINQLIEKQQNKNIQTMSQSLQKILRSNNYISYISNLNVVKFPSPNYIPINMYDVFREEDQSVLNFVFQCKGSLYGGYLRDVISGSIPNNMDVIIPKSYFNMFEECMNTYNYYKTVTSDDSCFFCEISRITVNVFIQDADPNTTILRPNVNPDFDINTLTYTSGILMTWTNYSNDDLNEIVNNIINRRAVIFTGCAQERMVKIMFEKGYTVVSVKESRYNV